MQVGGAYVGDLLYLQIRSHPRVWGGVRTAGPLCRDAAHHRGHAWSGCTASARRPPGKACRAAGPGRAPARSQLLPGASHRLSGLKPQPRAPGHVVPWVEWCQARAWQRHKRPPNFGVGQPQAERDDTFPPGVPLSRAGHPQPSPQSRPPKSQSWGPTASADHGHSWRFRQDVWVELEVMVIGHSTPRCRRLAREGHSGPRGDCGVSPSTRLPCRRLALRFFSLRTRVSPAGFLPNATRLPGSSASQETQEPRWPEHFCKEPVPRATRPSVGPRGSLRITRGSAQQWTQGAQHLCSTDGRAPS